MAQRIFGAAARAARLKTRLLLARALPSRHGASSLQRSARGQANQQRWRAWRTIRTMVRFCLHCLSPDAATDMCMAGQTIPYRFWRMQKRFWLAGSCYVLLAFLRPSMVRAGSAHGWQLVPHGALRFRWQRTATTSPAFLCAATCVCGSWDSRSCALHALLRAALTHLPGLCVLRRGAGSLPTRRALVPVACARHENAAGGSVLRRTDDNAEENRHYRLRAMCCTAARAAAGTCSM